ncbi:Cadherin domain protein [Rosistilla ulvae]|uniref:Cadherin domain protein n=1 Tax=Rosistilla ulvae TaxID=1930277 RepID=A0A517LZJ5_9BACT|nr:cadherin domain-containing protein [Rosistilla ulvae]QDS88043.1 Cadherin domain protein [Rosistilla ulvae]
MMHHRTKRQRGLRLEALERRHLLAGVISELSMDTTEQFFELRGQPDATIPQGTYFTVVESTGNSLGGRVETVLDLSGQSYGANGFLVVAQAGHSFSIDASANALVSSSTAMSGLPAGVHLAGDFSVFTATAFFLQSSTAPVAGDDIDLDNDGTIDPDGVAATWTIHDSVTIGRIHDFYGYGQTVFGPQSNQQSLQANSTYIPTDENTGDNYDYVARIGDSSGSGAEDWVAARLYDDFGDTQGLRLNNGSVISDSATPTVFSGRELDHVGTYNFFGGVRGRVTNNSAGAPIPGVTVLADTNGNGIRDVITTVIEPDSVLAGTEMTNLFPGITLSVADRSTGALKGGVSSITETIGLASTGTRVFGDDAASFGFNDVLRVDFYRDADSVQIDAIGDAFSLPAVVRMEAFNRDGESIAFTRSVSLQNGQRQQLRLQSATGEIASVLIYEESGNGWYVNYDRMVVTQKEAIAITDAAGEYHLGYLTPDSYQITIPEGVGAIPVLPVDATQAVTIDSTEHFDVDFVFTNNQPPVIDTTTLVMEVDENSPIVTPVGIVQASDPNAGQSIRYRLVDGTGRRYFALDPISGEIRVSNPRGLDFELSREYTLVVEASDSFLPRQTDQATITVSINNANDAPTFADNRFTVAEDAAGGFVLGTVLASDQDALNEDSIEPESPNAPIGEESGQFTFAIADPVWGEAFSIDPDSGVLTLIDPAVLDFETSPEMLLTIAATDQGLKPQTKLGQVRIMVLDANEPPQLDDTPITIGEDAQPGSLVALPAIFDPEGHDLFSRTIVSGNGQSMFEIDSNTGEIRLANDATLDYENQTTYQIVVRVVEVPDGDGEPATALSSETPLTIQVLNVDEPPQVEFDATAIAENAAAGTVVASVSAIDPEGEEVTITQRGGSTKFVFDPLTNQVKVADGAVLDFESDQEYSIQLRATDASFPPNFSDLIIPITVNDAPETPTIVSQTLTVPENSPTGPLNASVAAIDPDSNDPLRYEIVAGDGAAVFTIDDATGRLSLRPGTTLDFEGSQIEFALEILVTDSTGLFDTQTVQVVVQDVNERPTIRQDFANLQLQVGRRFCFTFGDDLFSDPDANTTFEVSLSSSQGELPDWLSYDSVTRNLHGTPQSDDVGVISLGVRVTDSGEVPLTASDAFTVSVLDSDVGDFYTSNCVSAWQNPGDRFDVNDDGSVAPIDAVIILNYLNRYGAQTVPEGQAPPHYLDVDGDSIIRPIDALQVLNYLNSNPSRTAVPAPEAEQTATATDAALLELTAIPQQDAATADGSPDATPAWNHSSGDADRDDEPNDNAAIDESLRQFLLA